MGSSQNLAMKQVIYLVLGLVALNDLCQAQFASQSCIGSNCSQNNIFGRKRRQVLEKILAEVEEREVAKLYEVAVARIKREIADMLDSLTMNVLEEEGRDEEAVVDKDNDHTQVKREAEADPYGRKKREITETIAFLLGEQFQIEADDCIGMNCNQNNVFI